MAGHGGRKYCIGAFFNHFLFNFSPQLSLYNTNLLRSAHSLHLSINNKEPKIEKNDTGTVAFFGMFTEIWRMSACNVLVSLDSWGRKTSENYLKGFKTPVWNVSSLRHIARAFETIEGKNRVSGSCWKTSRCLIRGTLECVIPFHSFLISPSRERGSANITLFVVRKIWRLALKMMRFYK